MACDDCGKGIDLTAGVDGADAPIITNVNVNADNTLTFTFSNGSTITTASAITFTQNNLSYVYYHYSSDNVLSGQTFQIAADELDADGDGFRIAAHGSLDLIGAAPLVVTFNGDVETIYDAVGDIPTGGAYHLTGDIYRKNSTEIVFHYNLRVMNFDFTDPDFDEGDLFDEISGIFTSTADFSSPINFNVGQSGGNIRRLTAYLIKND